MGYLLLAVSLCTLLGVLVTVALVRALLHALVDVLSGLRKPSLQPGDVLVVRSFGMETRCVVVDVDADGKVLIAPDAREPE